MKNKPKYDFCNLTVNSSSQNAELFFYGDIVSNSWGAWQQEDQYPDNVRELLNDIGDRDIDIHINSGGGSVFAGTAIYNMLKNTKGTKTVYIDGLAASIASVIAMAGDKIIMPENAFLMIHKPVITCFEANSDELKIQIDILNKLESGMIATYMSAAQDNVTENEIAEKLKDETWLSANEASKIFKNIVVSLANEGIAKIDTTSFKNYKHVPEQLKAQKAKPTSPPKANMSAFKNFEKLINIKFKNFEEDNTDENE